MKHYILFVIIPVALVSCGQREYIEVDDEATEVITKTKSELAMEQARAIVTDPSNWKSHAEKITLLGEYAQDLGITNSIEYLSFDRDAQKLMEFGTTMITNMDEASIDRLKNQLIRITDRSNSTLDASVVTPSGAPAAGTINVQSHGETTGVSLDAEAERIVYTSINGLRAAEAAKFGELFASAQESYRALRGLLQKTESEQSASSNH